MDMESLPAHCFVTLFQQIYHALRYGILMISYDDPQFVNGFTMMVYVLDTYTGFSITVGKQSDHDGFQVTIL